MGKEISIRWRPQPRQLTALRAAGVSHPFDSSEPRAPVARVVGYGGAAGGGKSDCLLLIGVISGLTWPGCKVGYFRRKYTQLEGPGGAIMRSQELLSGWAQWNGQQRRWTLPNGSIIEFCHCQNENDVYNYQSQQFDVILFDEATQFTKFQVRYLMTRNRLTVPMPAPICAMATNPGNTGHQWFKAQFVEIGPPETPARAEVEPDKYETHVFIPAKLSDNQVLEKRDPTYRQTLENQDEETRRMLLEGDWDVFAGQVFATFRRDVHVVRPEEVPIQPHFRRMRWMDWGFSAHAVCLWAAAGEVDGIPRLIIYREFAEKELAPSEIAARVVALSAGEDIDSTIIDSSVWDKATTGEVIGETLVAHGLLTIPAGKGPGSRIHGKQRMHEWLKPFAGHDGRPTARLLIYDTCRVTIQEIPSLTYDEHRIEDVDDNSGATGHADIYAALRYGLMSRPEPGEAPKPRTEATDPAERAAERERRWLERMNESETAPRRSDW